jgi:hypothetical protein
LSSPETQSTGLVHLTHLTKFLTDHPSLVASKKDFVVTFAEKSADKEGFVEPDEISILFSPSVFKKLQEEIQSNPDYVKLTMQAMIEVPS